MHIFILVVYCLFIWVCKCKCMHGHVLLMPEVDVECHTCSWVWAHMCVNSCMDICLWMSKVDVECHLQSLSTLFFESCVLFHFCFVFLLELGLIDSGSLATEILESTNPLPLIPRLLFRLWGYRSTASALSLFCCWGSEPRSPCFCFKHFTDGFISPALNVFLLWIFPLSRLLQWYSLYIGFGVNFGVFSQENHPAAAMQQELPVSARLAYEPNWSGENRYQIHLIAFIAHDSPTGWKYRLVKIFRRI